MFDRCRSCGRSCGGWCWRSRRRCPGDACAGSDGESRVDDDAAHSDRLPRLDAPEYGAHWWVDHDADAPRVAFFADGFAGQLLVVVPSLDLVVVALANSQDGRSDDAA